MKDLEFPGRPLSPFSVAITEELILGNEIERTMTSYRRLGIEVKVSESCKNLHVHKEDILQSLSDVKER